MNFFIISCDSYDLPPKEHSLNTRENKYGPRPTYLGVHLSQIVQDTVQIKLSCTKNNMFSWLFNLWNRIKNQLNQFVANIKSDWKKKNPWHTSRSWDEIRLVKGASQYSSPGGGGGGVGRLWAVHMVFRGSGRFECYSNNGQVWKKLSRKKSSTKKRLPSFLESHPLWLWYEENECRYFTFVVSRG